MIINNSCQQEIKQLPAKCPQLLIEQFPDSPRYKRRSRQELANLSRDERSYIYGRDSKTKLKHAVARAQVAMYNASKKIVTSSKVFSFYLLLSIPAVTKTVPTKDIYIYNNNIKTVNTLAIASRDSLENRYSHTQQQEMHSKVDRHSQEQAEGLWEGDVYVSLDRRRYACRSCQARLKRPSKFKDKCKHCMKPWDYKAFHATRRARSAKHTALWSQKYRDILCKDKKQHMQQAQAAWSSRPVQQKDTDWNSLVVDKSMSPQLLKMFKDMAYA